MEGIPKEVAAGTTISMEKVDWLMSEINKEPDMRQQPWHWHFNIGVILELSDLF